MGAWSPIYSEKSAFHLLNWGHYWTLASVLILSPTSVQNYEVKASTLVRVWHIPIAFFEMLFAL